MYLEFGMSSEEALNIAIMETIAFLSNRVHHGEPLRQTLRNIDIHVNEEIISGELKKVLDIIESQGQNYSDPELAISFIVRSGELSSIPSASCMEQHLPIGSMPTRTEIEKAWELCTSR